MSIENLDIYDETELDETGKARILLTGEPKAGKTVAVLSTAPGPVLVLNCDGPGAPMAARRHGAKNLKIVDVSSAEIWRRAVTAAITLANQGEVETIVVDTITVLVNQVLALEMTRKFQGYEIWRNVLDAGIGGLHRLLHAPAHVVVISHFAIDDGQLQLSGSLKTDVPALLHDRVHLDFVAKRDPERAFHIGPSASGLSGGRHSDENKIIPADMGILLTELGYKP